MWLLSNLKFTLILSLTFWSLAAIKGLLWSLAHYIMLSPFFLVDLYLSLIILILLSGLSLVFIIFSAFSGLSKYSIFGCIRLISQFVSFELMFTTIILMLIWSWNDLSIASMLFTEYLTWLFCLWDHWQVFLQYIATNIVRWYAVQQDFQSSRTEYLSS